MGCLACSPSWGAMGGTRKSKGAGAPPVTPAKRVCLSVAPSPASSSFAVSPGGQSSVGAFGPQQAHSLAIMTPTAHPSHFLVNAGHLADVEAAWQSIVDHPVFNGIVTECPLSLGQTGIAPFSVSDFLVSMSGGKPYTCGANAFWASPFFTTSPGVPINRHDVPSLVFGPPPLPPPQPPPLPCLQISISTRR